MYPHYLNQLNLSLISQLPFILLLYFMDLFINLKPFYIH